MRTVMEENEVTCCVRGYHVYKTVWAAAVGEVLICRREPTNSADRYAVAVLKEETIIEHLPRKMSKICSLFLRRGGSIRCKVTGSRRYSSDLPQGGLEIPCSLLFKANMKEITKLRKVLAHSSQYLVIMLCFIIYKFYNVQCNNYYNINH